MLISLALGFSAHCQIDIKSTLGISIYKDGVLVSNHNDEANAVQSFLNLRREFPNAEIEGLARGKLWATMSDDFFSSLSDTIEVVETIFRHELPTISELDTVMQITYLTSGLDSLNNHYIYGVTKTGKAISLKVKDTAGLHLKSLHDKPEYENFIMNVKFPRHTYSDRNYTFSDGELNEMFFHKVAHVERLKDSAQMTTQTYFNKVWWFSKKEANNMEDFKTAQWTPFGYNAGNPFPNIYRHTQSFKKKFNQIRAQDTLTGEIIELEMFANSELKGSLKLTNLRIDILSDGVTRRVRVTGNEPCQMRLYYKTLDQNGWTAIPPELSYNYSSHGMNAPGIVAGTTYNLMAVGRDINGLDIVLMALNVVAP